MTALFHNDADRRVATIIAALIAVAFVVIFAVALPKVIRHRRVAHAESQISRADKLLSDGNSERAAELLLALQADGVPDEFADELASRVSKLQPVISAMQARERAERNRRDRKVSTSRQRRDAENARRLREQKRQRLEAVGGASTGLGLALIAGFLGCVLAGMGQVIIAFRDIAVNSYVAAGQTDVPLNRTPVAPRRMAPAYRFIPFIAVIFYVLAGLLMFSAVLLLVFVVVSL